MEKLDEEKVFNTYTLRSIVHSMLFINHILRIVIIQDITSLVRYSMVLLKKIQNILSYINLQYCITNSRFLLNLHIETPFINYLLILEY